MRMHDIQRCVRCNAILRQCRCLGPHQTTYVSPPAVHACAPTQESPTGPNTKARLDAAFDTAFADLRSLICELPPDVSFFAEHAMIRLEEAKLWFSRANHDSSP